MAKHAWATAARSATRYTDQLNVLAGGARREPADPPRLRWRVPAVAIGVALLLLVSVIAALWVGGAFRPPERIIATIDTAAAHTRAGAGQLQKASAVRSDAEDPHSADADSESSDAGEAGGAAVGARNAGAAAVGAEVSGAGASDVGVSGGEAVVVHIAGAVQRPGIVRLPPGSRVHEAVVAAGGAVDGAELSAINLAAVLQDGQQLYVPTTKQVQEGSYPGTPTVNSTVPGPPGAAPGGTGRLPAASPAPSQPVNINTASALELETLPGVGPVLSQRIIDFRRAHGPFATLEQLDAVSGIGPKMLESLQRHATI